MLEIKGLSTEAHGGIHKVQREDCVVCFYFLLASFVWFFIYLFVCLFVSLFRCFATVTVFFVSCLVQRRDD